MTGIPSTAAFPRTGAAYCAGHLAVRAQFAPPSACFVYRSYAAVHFMEHAANAARILGLYDDGWIVG